MAAEAAKRWLFRFNFTYSPACLKQ